MAQRAGYQAPNYFQVPIAWYALLATIKNASELKVTLAVFRRTFGWHKRGDTISLSQLQKETGLTRHAVLDGITAALDRGTITRRESGKSWEYLVDVYYDLPEPLPEGEQPPGGPPAGEPPSSPSKDAQAVFDHYLTLCDEHDRHPRSRELTPGRRRLIDRALKEASVDECKAALTGLFLTPWYMERDQWDMRYVFGTKPGGRTLREQIDRFIDTAEQAGRGFAIPSVDPEKLGRAKVVIQQAHDLPDNETAQARAKRAEGWLESVGVIVDREGERPMFRSKS